MTATREQLLARLRLAERDYESAPLGLRLTLRELTRAQYRDAAAYADSVRAEQSGLIIASARLVALDATEEHLATLRASVAAYDAERGASADAWHAAIVAAGAVGDDGQPLMTRDEWQSLGSGQWLWDELRQIAQAILDLSEVGAPHLKSGDSAPDAE